MKDVLHFAVGIFGYVFSLALFLAPSFTFRRIVLDGNTGEFSGIPYAMTWLNCLLSTWYGLLFASPNSWLVSVVNGAGIIIEFIYVVLFLRFTPNWADRASILRLMTVEFFLFLWIVLASWIAGNGNDVGRIFGIITSLLSILTYASPLAAMGRVIETQNTESMPFLLSLCVFLCATTWMIFGILGNDLLVIVPNGFGCGLGLFQLITWIFYHNYPDPQAQPQAHNHPQAEAQAA